MALNLNKLNERQREAVLHGKGPLLVLAGAGSGKTSTMAYRIAHLIASKGISANNILGLSFTNKAAKELKERVKKLVTETAGSSATKNLTISTFHSLCVRILRAHGSHLGFRSDFSILDENDQKDVLKQVMKNIKIDDQKFDLDRILFEIGQAKNRFMSPSAAEGFFLESGRLSSDYGIAAASSYSQYQEQLKVLNSMDFDDLLFNAVTLLEEYPAVRAHYNQRFQYVLVDEYQDTNPSQFRLLSLLTQTQQNICVVGDDDQSIYAWRGADPTHILEFHHHFKGAKRITLDQNYRSTTTILDAANQVIRNNKKRHPKTLWSERGEGEPITEVVLDADREEAKYVAEQILHIAQEKNRPWKDFAVLYRSNAQSRVFEESMRLLRVPYHIVGGYSFLERKEVKNTLAYWRLIVNPNDDASLRRVINWPSRGLGRTTVEKMGNHAFATQKSLYDVLAQTPDVSPKALTSASHFHSQVTQMREELNQLAAPNIETLISQLTNWARKSLEKFQIKKGVEEDSDDPIQLSRKWENVEELIHAIGQFRPEPSTETSDNALNTVGVLRDFLAHMTLDPKDEEEEDDGPKNEVTLLTLHGAKGLEYPVVFLVGLEDGFLPHRRTLEGLEDLDEERRLCYVGITRARDYLYLTRAKNRVRFGKEVPRYRSRFLAEIDTSLLLQNDESTKGELEFGKEARKEHEAKVKSYLDSIRTRLSAGT